MNIHGKKLDDDQVFKFVKEYFTTVSNKKGSRYNAILKMIGKKKLGYKILDYGCGWGCISKGLSDKLLFE